MIDGPFRINGILGGYSYHTVKNYLIDSHTLVSASYLQLTVNPSELKSFDLWIHLAN